MRKGLYAEPQKAQGYLRISQEVLALEAGVDPTRLERKLGNPTVVVPERLATRLGITIGKSIKPRVKESGETGGKGIRQNQEFVRALVNLTHRTTPMPVPS